MDNKKIAAVFEEMGDILDIKGENVFRVNAYRRAALTTMNFPKDLRDLVDDSPRDLSKIPGIGKDLSSKIIELVNTGVCREHIKLKKSFPEGLLEMLHLRGVGPKKVKLFYYSLKIESIKELKDAAQNNLLQGLEKMGEKSEKDILKAIDEYARFSTKRFLISEARMEAEHIIEYMKKLKEIDQIEFAGSLRRGKESIGDIDILVTVKNMKDTSKVIDHFVNYNEVLDVIVNGDTKSTVFLESGIDVDLRVVNNESFGAALHYFTGSKNHNIRVRDLAKRKKLKINEYGVFRDKKMISGKKEEDIFKAVGLPYVIPEIRRDSGEIEYGLKHKKFPKFIELSDIKGDLHSHTENSDGRRTMEEMANAFIERGYSYYAVTDHSSAMGITGGLGESDIKKQWEKIDALNKKLKGKIKILKGSEVDIMKDGSLNFDNDILKGLDVVIIASHMYSRLPADVQTARLIAAIENPYSRILAHPTGRLLNKRLPSEFNMEKVIDACVTNNVALEINSNPQRLDLSEKYLVIANDKGAKITINTDSHDLGHPLYMKYGIQMARRGWLTPKDVINTLNLKDLTAFLK